MSAERVIPETRRQTRSSMSRADRARPRSRREMSSTWRHCFSPPIVISFSSINACLARIPPMERRRPVQRRPRDVDDDAVAPGGNQKRGARFAERQRQPSRRRSLARTEPSPRHGLHRLLPMYSAIPASIVNDGFDGVVSPDEGKRIGTSLLHGRYCQIPGVGHVVLSGKCATETASQFPAHPGAKPNADCLGSLPEIVFGH